MRDDVFQSMTEPTPAPEEACWRCGQVGVHTTAPGWATTHRVCLACADELWWWLIEREEQR